VGYKIHFFNITIHHRVKVNLYVLVQLGYPCLAVTDWGVPQTDLNKRREMCQIDADIVIIGPYRSDL
jgi:hypothetical protein